MKAKLFQVLLLTITLFSIRLFSLGQTDPPPKSKDRPDQFSINKIYKDKFYTFQVDPEYDYASVDTGSNPILKIIISTAAENKQNLEIIDCTPEDKSSLIQISRTRSDTQNTNGFLVSVTEFSVQIPENTEPRQHRIKLQLQFADEKVFEDYFVLRVYARRRDEKQSIVIKDEDAEPRVFFTGESGLIPVTLRNNSSDYKLDVTKISIESIPSEVVDFTENALVDGPVTLEPRKEKRVELKFKIRSFSFRNLISGIGENPRLKLIVTYSDQFKRETTDKAPLLPVKIRPPDKVLIMAMLAGVLIGGLIRFYLEFLARNKKITQRELFKFVLYTVIFGLVVTAIALLGEIQVSVFKASGSYDKPMAIFILGLAGAVGGLQLFVGWYNTLRPAEAKIAQSEGEKEKRPTKRVPKREPSKDEKAREDKEASEDEKEK